MEIYVVTAGAYSSYGIVAVFTDKSKAEIFCAIHNGDSTRDRYGEEYYLETYKSADDDVEGYTDIQYSFVVHQADKFPRDYFAILKKSPENKDYIINYTSGIRAVVYLTKNDPELAFKIGKDMIAKYKAEQAGL